MSKTVDVKIPDIGDFKDVPIIEIIVKPGDVIKKDDTILSLESDKATMDVPAPEGGKVVEILAKVGDKVGEGSVVLRLESGADVGASAAPAPSASAPAASAAAPAATPATASAPAAKSAAPKLADFTGVYASPAVRRLARELDLDLNALSGTGEKGRITKEDVKAYLSGGAGKTAGGGAAVSSGMGIPEIPAVDFAKYGPIETKPMSRIKKLSGPHLHRAWLNIPHVTHNDEADITSLEAFRKKLDEDGKLDKKAPYRVSLLPFLIKAAVDALKTYPDFNASLTPSKDGLIYKHYWNIGVAVDTPDGLVVPVIKEADRKGVIEISRELGAISTKAREGKLSPAEMQGATFSISSLGGIGGTAFTPIVNAPEVAILGVVRSKMAPLWNGSEFVPALMLPLSLSYDHRVVDGAAAARFTRRLCATLEDVRRLIL